METVNHVPRNQKRNAQPGLFYTDALHFIDLFWIHHIKHGTHLAFAQAFGIVANVTAAGDLVHLADLLGKGHLGKQLVYLLFCRRLRAPTGERQGK